MFSEVVDGSASTEITFVEPGEYRLRVQASDGDKLTDAFVDVTATQSASR
jgi:translation initiation factor 2 alpha subunit (eIF-2alpha)